MPSNGGTQIGNPQQLAADLNDNWTIALAQTRHLLIPTPPFSALQNSRNKPHILRNPDPAAPLHCS